MYRRYFINYSNIVRYFGTYKKNKPPNPTKFGKLFDKNNNVQTQKVNNSYNNLYEEFMGSLYDTRLDLLNKNTPFSKKVDYNGTSTDTTTGSNKENVIDKLTKDEQNIINNIFNKYIKTSPSTSTSNKNKENANNNEIAKLKLEILHEFGNLSRLVNEGELHKYRLLIRRALKLHNNRDNQNFNTTQGFTSSQNDYTDTNLNRDEKQEGEYYYDVNTNRTVLSNNPNHVITFRDVNLLGNFVAGNGQILPRRINLVSPKQQRRIFNAVKLAKVLLLMPLDLSPAAHNRIPLLYPPQFLHNELLFKYVRNKDKRSKCLLNVLIGKYRNINCYKYLRYESQNNNKGD